MAKVLDSGLQMGELTAMYPDFKTYYDLTKYHRKHHLFLSISQLVDLIDKSMFFLLIITNTN